MRFIHLSDLHIGKRVNEFSMLEEQEYILGKILNIIDDENVDCVIIAGDVYDKSVPSAEAVQVFDKFLYNISKRDIKVFVISGNHDSAERIAFGSNIMDKSGVYMSPVYDGNIKSVKLQDKYGNINVFMIPFIKPAHVRRYFENKNIETYTDMMRAVIGTIDTYFKERNIIITHQFVTGATRCESEEISVGGSDNIDADVFENFDYVALGHIHGPQYISRETIRYCGTPLKYSFSEIRHNKSVTVVDMNEKGNISIKKVPLTPKRDMREIRGNFEDITRKEYYEKINRNDYMHIILTDENDVNDAIGKLRVIYPNIMKLDYDNKRTRSEFTLEALEDVKDRNPVDLFSEFYESQNGQTMSDEQREFILKLTEEIWGDIL
ncbi:exonuclease sbcCD subunit D [Tyzzerella sp. An114]|uniref:exonuclease SbcCD subunit D n=1 Tax=Tyzzerella sp. An114 TaxID=1965545 RepID=UPI000B44CC7C|nr:exonuclease SbcCD subunit D [Tyzzerella sp. An114]OUQ59598.1 exonuclease sbcCD subunit D [Tyzzerella sp. An114]